jgi:hypothetical protein
VVTKRGRSWASSMHIVDLYGLRPGFDQDTWSSRSGRSVPTDDGHEKLLGGGQIAARWRISYLPGGRPLDLPDTIVRSLPVPWRGLLPGPGRLDGNEVHRDRVPPLGSSRYNGPVRGFRKGNSHTCETRSCSLRTRPPKQSSVNTSSTAGVLAGLRPERDDLQVAHPRSPSRCTSPTSVIRPGLVQYR